MRRYQRGLAIRQLCVAVALCIVGSDCASYGQQRPEALEQLEAYRAALRTGHVEWSIVDNAAKFYRGETRFKTSKFAEVDLITTDRGDADGVVLRTTDGKPADLGGTKPYSILNANGQVWRRSDDPLGQTDVFPGAMMGRELDLRTLGVSAAIEYRDIQDVLWRDLASNPAPWKYREWTDGELHVVRVQKTNGFSMYWLDPRRAWAPVRVRTEYEGYGWFESRSTLKQFDGVWYPETVQMFSSRYEDGREPAQIARVYSATFNRPEHPQRLTPADIGVEVGTDVVCHDEDRHQTLGKWDGDSVVPLQEFASRLRSGELKEGPRLTREVARAQEKLAKERISREPRGSTALLGDVSPLTVEHASKSLRLSPRQLESLWEAYTRSFIAKYQLDEEQTQKALSILRLCQERADAYVAKHSEELKHLDERVRACGQAEGKERVNIERQIQQDRERLLRPIDDIFEQQLKPRLERLPTRAQRQAAGEAQEQRGAGKEGEENKEKP